MLRSFGIYDDGNVSSAADNPCEVNRCPTAQRQGQSSTIAYGSGRGASFSPRLSTPPPSFSPMAASSGHRPRRMICPLSSRSPPTPYPNRSGSPGGCPYAYSPDSSSGSSSNRTGSPRSPRNVTYTVAPGSNVSSFFYGLTDTLEQSSTLRPDQSSSQGRSHGGDCTCDICSPGGRTVTNRSSRRANFNDTTPNYHSPMMTGVNFPSGSPEMSALPDCDCPRVDGDASYISSTGGYNVPGLHHPNPGIVRNPTMFDTPRPIRGTPPRSNQPAFNIYEDSSDECDCPTDSDESRPNIHSSTPTSGVPAVSFGSVNLSTIDEYDDEACTDETCPYPASGSWPTPSSGNTQPRSLGGTYTVSPGAQQRQLGQTYSVSPGTPSSPTYGDEACTDETCPNPASGSWPTSSSGNTQTRSLGGTYTVSPRQLGQTYSISPGTSSSPTYSSSNYTNQTPPNFYTPPSKYGGWNPQFHSTMNESSCKTPSGACDETACSEGPSGHGASTSRNTTGGRGGSHGDQSSSLGILGPGFFDTTRVTTDESSLGILNCSCFDTTPLDESSLGILNSSAMASSLGRSTTQDTSLGILGSEYFQSSSNTQDSSLGILNSSAMDSGFQQCACGLDPRHARSRSAEPPESSASKQSPSSSPSTETSPPTPPPPPPTPTSERSVQHSTPTRRPRRSGSDSNLATTLQSISGRLATIETNVLEIAGRMRDLHPPHPHRRRQGESVMPLKQRDKSDLSQKVVIPRGMINPGETTIIEIPASLHKEPVVVAKRKGVDPSRDPSCSRQPATPCYKGPAPESQRRPARNISPNPSFTYTLNSTPEYQPAFNATLKGSKFDPPHHSSGYGSQMGVADMDQTEQRERAELQHLLDDFQRARRKLIDTTSKMANKVPPNVRGGRDSFG